MSEIKNIGSVKEGGKNFMKLLKMVGKWKLGVAALAALGLSVLPASFNVPGVGVVQAFADDLTDLAGATVTVTAVDFKNAAYDPAADLAIASIKKVQTQLAIVTKKS